MYKEVWNSYKKGFKFLLPFILVKTLFENSSFNLRFSEYGLFGQGGNPAQFFLRIKTLLTSEAGPILFSLFIGTLFYSFLMVTIKTLVNENRVSYMESFKESLGFYLRYLGLNIITYILFLGLMFLSGWPLLGVFVFIFLIYFTVVLAPCEEYLVYYDANPVKALKSGMIIGKKYFMEILVISIIPSIISSIGMRLTTNHVIYSSISFMVVSMEIYLYMFVMNICKKEKMVRDKVIQC